jgi:single-stranded-DNA-specific exonuclease
MKRWKILTPDKSAVEKLSKEAGISPLLAWLLLNRDIATADRVKKFLDPQYEHLFEGMDLEIFSKGASLLKRALAEGKRIGIYGDYDVDGITATALLIEFLSKIGAQPEYFLPHRIDDGYGLRETGIKELKSKGVDFLIAVDCGISDFSAVKLAKELGLTVMIVDHHRPSEALPCADLIIDPHLSKNPSGLEQLCSAGLVFFLLMMLRRLLRDKGFFQQIAEPNLRRFLDMVALGTVADVAPALGLNRILLNFGIKEIEQTSRFGLRVLKKRAGIDDKELGYGSVAFALAPSLNAAGRINEADLGLELLLTQDPKRANELADELERRNQQRQRIEEQILKDALEQINSFPDKGKRKSLVVAGEGWHPGVIGIVAQRLREQFFRPAIVISFHQGIGKGSGRSINGFDLYSGLSECQAHLLEFGGHRLACGLSLKESELEAFREAFEKVVCERVSDEALEEVLVCDAELPLYQITPELISEIEKLKPYGPGNYEPILVARSVMVLDVHIVKDKHLWLLVRERESSYRAWMFRSWIQDLAPGSLVDLAYSIERLVYKGESRTRLLVKDLKRVS